MNCTPADYRLKKSVGQTTAARNDWELLDFLLKKIPNKFNLSFTKMCVREGFIEVVDWWKEVELVEGGSLRELVSFSCSGVNDP
jgi:hypothetical protein